MSTLLTGDLKDLARIEVSIRNSSGGCHLLLSSLENLLERKQVPWSPLCFSGFGCYLQTHSFASMTARHPGTDTAVCQNQH